MNQRMEHVTPSVRDTCLEGLFYLPVAVSIGRLIEQGGQLLIFTLSLFVIRVVGVFVTRYVHRRIWLFCVGLIVSALDAVLFPATVSQRFVLFLLAGASFWRSIRIVGASEYLYPQSLYVIGLLTYAGYAGISFYYPIYRPLLWLITTLAFVCILLYLVLLNRTTLLDASFTETDRVDIDRKVKETNRIHLAALFGVILFLSLFWPVVGTLSHDLAAWMAGHPHHAQVPVAHKRSGTSAPLMQQSGHTGLASRILSIVLQTFGIALVVVVGAWFALQAGRLIISIVLRLFHTLAGRVNPENQAYVDHVDRLKGPSIKDRMAFSRVQRTKRSPRWSDLHDAREKTRFVYRRLVQEAISHGLLWSSSKDASEVIRKVQDYVQEPNAKEQLEPFTEMYHRARYSEHPLTDAESEVTLAALKNARIERKPEQ